MAVWNNEQELQFIEYYQAEPVLWNVKLKQYKNKFKTNDAWRRISEMMEVEVEELKKKKDSLLSSYRSYRNKVKKSAASGAGADEIYQPIWFAYDAMDSFLNNTLKVKKTINTSAEKNDKTNESTEEVSQNESNPGPSTSTENCLNNECECTSGSAINRRNIKTFKRPHVQNQKSKTPPNIIHAKKQMDDAFQRLQSITSQKREQLDEYDHFGFMIASKIRKLQDPDDREILMNSIQNIAFEFYMKNKQSLLVQILSNETIIPDKNN